jgi:hypothetical protein
LNFIYFAEHNGFHPLTVKSRRADAMTPYRPRRAGSARYSAYFKVQVWDSLHCAWRDIQKQHPTAEAAIAAFPDGANSAVSWK